ncbi:PPK2 family polyphosphate kinase [Roseomonas sp. KE0001]|uniref:PPK2 family polyphosphate kinase n=1 Tax=Roseomonas sp. KE0001 TaxID=2479201 RepID=UPI0018DEF3E4|nr:PPK2 family polyphosphate kinase [Roseomonas sp. KE0001]MBI0435800.1 polyphosphate kinase 2 family protein [Roseomonas sp. KE0001]
MPRDIAQRLTAACRVEHGKDFRLADHPTRHKTDDLDRGDAKKLLQEGVARLSELQDRLYAQDRHAVFVMFQAMDAAGKDGAIKHVFTGLNPQGCQVHAFKAPGPVELDMDFMRRHVLRLPSRGMIGIHNRSWYEEVLVVRLHPSILERQKLPPEVVSPEIWDQRLEDIAAYERYLARQGMVVLKFFLHLSPEEQRRRFLDRIREPEKNWKLEPSDIAERRHWTAYQEAYEAAIRATAAPHAPWYVVPADQKWMTRLIVVEAMIEALEGIDPHYPKMTEAGLKAMAEARQALEAETDPVS